MPLTLDQKQAVVAEVARIASQAHSAVAAEYRGLSVAHMTELRARARQAGVDLRVVRNTLARRAVKGTGFECLHDRLQGPLVLAFSREDASAAARVMDGFAKENDKLVIKLVAVGGRLLDAEQVSRLAELPTREEAIARLMATLKAPISRLARTLIAPHAKLVRTLAAVREQKQAT